MRERSADMYESRSYLVHLRRIRRTRKVRSATLRERKAQKVLAVIEDFGRRQRADLATMSCLDVGCSSGSIVRALAPRFRLVAGVDTDRVALSAAASACGQLPNVRLIAGTGMALPFPAASFDVVICNHVYEHVPEAEKLLSEIHRVMKDSGFCYFTAGNRYKLMEGHYRLPLLSWLPRPLADAYVRFAGYGEAYEERHRSYWGIRRLLARFQVHDYTLELIRHPDRFQMTELLRPGSPMTRIPMPVLQLLEPAIPTFVFVLTKAKP